MATVSEGATMPIVYDYGSCYLPPQNQRDVVVSSNERNGSQSHQKRWIKRVLVAIAVLLAGISFYKVRQSDHDATDSVKAAPATYDGFVGESNGLTHHVPTLLCIFETFPGGIHLVNAVNNPLYVKLIQSFRDRGFELYNDVPSQSDADSELDVESKVAPDGSEEVEIGGNMADYQIGDIFPINATVSNGIIGLQVASPTETESPTETPLNVLPPTISKAPATLNDESSSGIPTITSNTAPPTKTPVTSHFDTVQPTNIIVTSSPTPSTTIPSVNFDNTYPTKASVSSSFETTQSTEATVTSSPALSSTKPSVTFVTESPTKSLITSTSLDTLQPTKAAITSSPTSSSTNTLFTVDAEPPPKTPIVSSTGSPAAFETTQPTEATVASSPTLSTTKPSVTFDTVSPTKSLITSSLLDTLQPTKATVTSSPTSSSTYPLVTVDTEPPTITTIVSSTGSPAAAGIGDEREPTDLEHPIVHDIQEEMEGKKCHTTDRTKNRKHEIKLVVDRKRIQFHDKLVVRWADESSKDELYEDDIIALYCPAHETDPTKFREAATIGQIISTNLASQFARTDQLLSYALLRSHKKDNKKYWNEWSIESFPIIREDTCEFRLWRLPCVNKTEANAGIYIAHDSVQLLSQSEPFEIADARVSPTAIHLALTEFPDEMLVQFTTGFLAGSTPVVRYIKKKHLNYHHNNPVLKGMKEVKGVSSSYTASDMCDAPANVTEAGKFIDPGILHKVKLQHLKSDTEYAYMVGLKPRSRHDDDDIVWSKVYSFRSAPRVGDTHPFRIIVYGDQGCPGGGWLTGAVQIEKLVEREITRSQTQIRAVHHIGDLSYATGAAHVWDEWFDMIQPMAARVPLMIAIGNHEYDHVHGGFGKDPSGVQTNIGFHPSWGDYGNDSGGECGVPTAARFTMPSTTTKRRRFPSNGVFWYSYDMSNVHVVVISSEHDLSKGSDQHNWLKEDLSMINRKVTPWVILEGHRPLYESQMAIGELTAEEKVSAVQEGLRDEFEWLLREYKVDLVLSGHFHSYLRTCKGLFQNVCDNGGPLYITVGSAGAPLLTSELYPGYLPFTEKFIRSWGYGRITVESSSKLIFEFVGDAKGEIEDSVWLLK